MSLVDLNSYNGVRLNDTTALPYEPVNVTIYPQTSQPQPAPRGWLCPRCNRSNAPHVDQCPCSPQGIVSVPSVWTPLNPDMTGTMSVTSTTNNKYTVWYDTEGLRHVLNQDADPDDPPSSSALPGLEGLPRS